MAVLAPYLNDHLEGLVLPPLPHIADDDLRELSFTHSSTNSVPRHANDIRCNRPILDYEKLEHVGDSLIGVLVTLVLDDEFPTLQPGPATTIKGHLASNATLSQLSLMYNLPGRLLAAPSARLLTTGQQSIQSALFESYAAAVYYDFLRSELPGVRVEASNGSNDDQTAAKTSSARLSDTASPPSPVWRLLPLADRTRGHAIDYLSNWLTPIFKHLAHASLSSLRDIANTQPLPSSPDEPADDAVVGGATAALNQWCMSHFGSMPLYDPGTKKTEQGWRVECRVPANSLSGPFTTEAVRTSVKAAKAVAAWKALRILQVPHVAV